MKKQVFKWFIRLVAGFLVLFGLRLLYGYIAYPDGTDMLPDYEEESGFDLSVRNFASYEKSDFKSSPATGMEAVPDAMQAGSMKYEKVGVVRSRTAGFDREERNTRGLIAQYKVLVQFEQSSGLKGKRILHLGLGVVPEKFDEVVERLRKIGRLRSIRVNKTDKTNEYRELRAKRISLEKTRDALVELKSRGGSVEEAISLENRIFDIEQELQSLGVKLGEFDTENEFCTVKFSLYETASLDIPFAGRLKTAFEWTVKFYLGLLLVLLLAAVIAFLVAAVIEKINTMSAEKNTANAQKPPQS
jgi:hypothetical protein